MIELQQIIVVLVYLQILPLLLEIAAQDQLQEPLLQQMMVI